MIFSPLRTGCALRCDRRPKSFWSVRFAIGIPWRLRCRRRKPGSSCTARCTRSARPRRSIACLACLPRKRKKQVRERLAETLRYVISQRLAPKEGGGRLLITELMGSSLRTREAIALGENENRRLLDAIEAGSTSGWHSFEQSLTRAYEQKLITEETALLYCVNRNLMRQRLDVINKGRDGLRAVRQFS